MQFTVVTLARLPCADSWCIEAIARLKYGEVIEAASREMQAELSNAIGSFGARGLARSEAVEAEKLRIRLASCERICRSVHET